MNKLKYIILALTISTVLLPVTLHASVYSINQNNVRKYTVLDPEKIWRKTNRENHTSSQLLSVVSLGYRTIMSSKTTITSEVETETKLVLTGRPLVYPNPFRLTDTAAKDAEIGYELTTNGDVEIRIYDFRAYEVYNKFFVAGTLGASVGYNRVPLSKSEFDYQDMPSGIYVYLIIHNQEIIGKGKFVIKP